MSWTKLCDTFVFHRKTLAAGNEAAGAWARMLSFVGLQGTDGVIAADMALVIAQRQEVIDRLVRVGLLEPHPDGYQMHDYLEHNERSEVLKAKAKRTRDQRKKAAEARWSEHEKRGSDASRIASRISEPASAESVRARNAPTRPDPTRPPPSEEEEITFGDLSGAGRQGAGEDGPSLALVPAVGGIEIAERGAAAQAIARVEDRYRSYGHTLKPSAKSPHRKHLRARIAEGWSAEDLALAIDGNHLDDWHAKVGKHDLAYVFRNSEQVARFVDVAKNGGTVDMAREIERAAIAREYGSDEP